MLIILNDPAGVTGRHRHELDPSVSLQANIERHVSCGFECALKINGQEVDPITDPRLDEPPKVSDTITLTRRPAGGGLGQLLGGLAGPSATQAVVGLLVPAPDSPQIADYDSSGTAVSKNSPNNSLTAQANVARAYQAIPDVYGLRRVWPDLIQPSTVEYIDHIKFVTEWLCVSRGRGSISDVQYADTSILNIAGATYQVFEPQPSAGYPEFSSTVLSDVLETFESPEVNGQELDYPGEVGPIVRTGSFSALSGATSFTITVPDGAPLDNVKALAPSGTAVVQFSYGSGPTTFNQTCTLTGFTTASGLVTFTFTSTAWGADASGSGIAISINPNLVAEQVLGPYSLAVACSRIHWNIVFPRGLKGTVQIRATWWKVGDGGDEISGTRETRVDTFASDTFDQRFYTLKATPAAGEGKYRAQFSRVTAQVDANGSDIAKLEEVYAVRYYPTKTLPGVTIIRVTTKATEQATGYSERKFNVRWSRHVRTLTADAVSASRNFGRIMAHIWTLSGNQIAGLDVAKLAQINAEFGEDAPLLRFDGSFDDADLSLGERLQIVANHARCTVWRDGPRWTVTRDQLRPYPEMQFDYRNLAASGESSIAYAAHLPASFDGIELEYVKESTQSTKAYVRLSIASGAVAVGSSRNPKKIRLSGCTTTAQAENRAQMEARRILYQRTTVSDTALSDAAALGLGALVRWVDPADFGGQDGLQAGEVISISGDLITTSEPVEWAGQVTGRILLTGTDGQYLGAPVECYPGEGGRIELASVPAGLYVADGARQCGSRYAFAPGLTAAEVESQGLYTLTEATPSGNGTVSIALAQYDPRIYEAD